MSQMASMLKTRFMLKITPMLKISFMLKIASNPAVHNLWVATPRGVAIDFHWGCHWSSDIFLNPCTIAHPQCSLLSLTKIVLSKLLIYTLNTVLYTYRNITGHSNFVCVAYFFVFQQVGSPFFVK